MSFIDANVCLGTWPLKMARRAGVADLEALFDAEDIAEALVSPIEAILLYDPSGPNAELFRETRGHPRLVPLPVLNLKLRNWGALLESYTAEQRVRAVLLYPSWHGYSVDSPEVDRLAQLLVAAGKPLVIALRVEDERYQHAQLPVAGVQFASVLAFADRHPALQLLCLNAYRAEAVQASGHDNVHVDISFVEIYPTLPNLLGYLRPSQILFGSHVPFFVARAAAMKVAWADIPQEARRAISFGNARRLFGL
jgi:hypothetical protein